MQSMSLLYDEITASVEQLWHDDVKALEKASTPCAKRVVASQLAKALGVGYEAALPDQAGAGGDAPSVIVAWWVPEEQAPLLKADHPKAEPADKLHMTMSYLGKEDEVDVEHVRAVLKSCAESHSPYSGQITGSGRFVSAEPGKDADILLVDVPRLEELRDYLQRSLAGVGISPMAKHGFVPHITRAYLAPDDPSIPAPPKVPVTIRGLTLGIGSMDAQGDTEFFPFTGTSAGLYKGAENISPDDHRKLKALLDYYRKKPHPFGSCVRDNTKRFGKGGAERVCATLKDEIEGNPYWRNKPGPGR